MPLLERFDATLDRLAIEQREQFAALRKNLLEAAGGKPDALGDLEQAVREAIQVRFRPIVLTVVTAALGMLPTALGFGQGAAPEQGLAVVILGGLIWSAGRSTNLIPALYLYWRRKQLAKARAA